MKSINFDEGYKEYKINDDAQRTIRIRLTDPNLLNRINEAMEKTEQLTRKYKNRPSASELISLDKEVRAIVNDAFGTDVCTPVLGSSNVLTLSADEKFVLISFFYAFLPILKEDIEAAAMTMKLRQPEIRPEVNKYLEPVTVAPVSKPIAALSAPFDDGLPDVSRYTPEQKAALLAKLGV